MNKKKLLVDGTIILLVIAILLTAFYMASVFEGPMAVAVFLMIVFAVVILATVLSLTVGFTYCVLAEVYTRWSKRKNVKRMDK